MLFLESRRLFPSAPPSKAPKEPADRAAPPDFGKTRWLPSDAIFYPSYQTPPTLPNVSEPHAATPACCSDKACPQRRCSASFRILPFYLYYTKKMWKVQSQLGGFRGKKHDFYPRVMLRVVSDADHSSVSANCFASCIPQVRSQAYTILFSCTRIFAACVLSSAKISTCLPSTGS